MKKIIVCALISLVVIFGYFYFKDNYFGERTDGGSSASDSVVINEDQSATTTPTYFTAGTTASSTKTITIEPYSKVVPNVCVTASTTATVFNWTVELGDNTTAAGTTWFGQRDYTETSNLVRTWGSGIVYNTWTPNNLNASTTCAQLFTPDDFIGRRAKFTYNVTGADGAVFFQTLSK